MTVMMLNEYIMQFSDDIPISVVWTGLEIESRIIFIQDLDKTRSKGG